MPLNLDNAPPTQEVPIGAGKGMRWQGSGLVCDMLRNCLFRVRNGGAVGRRVVTGGARIRGSSAGFCSLKSLQSQSRGPQGGGGPRGKSGPHWSRNWVVRPLLAVLIPYSGYAVYVSVNAAREVEQRQKQYLRECGDGDMSWESTLVKYSPLQVLGRFENPFVEYRIQTIYEFFFNRVVELFETNRGGIPPDLRQMSKLMPVHVPSWSDDVSNTGQKEEDNNDPGPSIAWDSLKILPTTECNNIITQDSRSNSPSSNDCNSSQHIPIYNTWLGQSCNYIVYNGLKILTDPIFSDHLLHEKFGPQRITGIPCDINDLPQPDIILVSHNHPDHLDPLSLQFWKDNLNTLWIIPKGMNKFFRKHDVRNFIELSWWESCQLTNSDGEVYTITSTPAMHWSGRSILDTNESLWCSFMLSHQNKPILFHAGDTGYVSDLYLRIKEIFGKGCRLALLPCGQYCPEWHQRPRHINPNEVIKIMKDMEIQNVLGVHWGTFLLSGEYFLEPKQKLELLAEFDGIRDRCYCPELGKTERFD